MGRRPSAEACREAKARQVPVSVDIMKQAGELADLGEWTDEQLALMIRAGHLVRAYLQGRGTEWWLARRALGVELEQWEGFAARREESRRQDKA